MPRNDEGNMQDTQIVIVGAGFAGLALGRELKRNGIEDFVIFESSNEVGGTWNHNRYPGAEVDTLSRTYSLSGWPYPWKRTHAAQEEILHYLKTGFEKYDLLRHVRFETTVENAVWNEPAHEWLVKVSTSALPVKARFLTAAVGFLNVPFLPDFPGIEDYRGIVVHPARWDPAIQLDGRRVSVIGTGSTSVSIVGAIAERVESLTLFQRTPNWIMPKGVREYSSEERARLAKPGKFYLDRFKNFVRSELGRIGGRNANQGSRLNEKLRRRGLAHLDREIGADHPLYEQLLPDIPYFGKRPVYSDDFYPALKRSNVELVPHRVVGFDAEGPIDQNGEVHPSDVVIASTGFAASNYLSNIEITGAQGVTLSEHWGDDPSAYLGVMVPGFPNFFIMYGPHTNQTLVVHMLESQARFITRAVKKAESKGSETVEVREQAAEAFDEWVQRKLERTVWALNDSYFRSPSGRVATQWPTSSSRYRWMTAFGPRRALVFHTDRTRPRTR